MVDANGVPIINATLKFKLTTPISFTVSHIVVDREFTVVTDGDGEFAITLWCDEDSLIAVNYNVYFPLVNSGLPSDAHVATFSLDYGDGSTVNLPEIIMGSTPAPTPTDLLYTFIETTVDEAVAVPRSVFEIPGHYPQCSFPAAGVYGAAVAGHNNLYTVPANRKALLQDFMVTNVSGGTIQYYAEIKIGATYYRIGNAAVEANNGYGHNYGMSATRNSQPIVLNPGEIFSVNCDNPGLTIWANIIEFDVFSPLKRADIHNWVTGQNTLLTVSPGRTLYIGSIGFTVANNPGTAIQGIVYYNNSGASRTFTGIYIVPSGGSPAANNTFATTNVITNLQGFSKFFPGCLAPGTSIIIDVDSDASGQFMWCNYFEL